MRFRFPAVHAYRYTVQVLCASNADHTAVKTIEPPAGAAPGARVTVQGTEGEPATPSQIQKKKVRYGTVRSTFDTRMKVYPMSPSPSSWANNVKNEWGHFGIVFITIFLFFVFRT